MPELNSSLPTSKLSVLEFIPTDQAVELPPQNQVCFGTVINLGVPFIKWRSSQFYHKLLPTECAELKIWSATLDFSILPYLIWAKCSPSPCSNSFLTLALILFLAVITVYFMYSRFFETLKFDMILNLISSIHNTYTRSLNILSNLLVK